jgi:hypothetical protein
MQLNYHCIFISAVIVNIFVTSPKKLSMLFDFESFTKAPGMFLCNR